VSRSGWVAAGVGAAVSAVANPAIRKGYWQLYWAVGGVVRNPPMEWVDQHYLRADVAEKVSRRARWRITRPTWTRHVGTVGFTCGCARSLFTGRMAFYRYGCPKHWPKPAGDDDA
jgi:hypothetical protein